MVYGRSPYTIRLRTPPLPGGCRPPDMASEDNLKPEPLQYIESQHSQRLGVRCASSIPLACSVFGKAAGTGTAVSELHRCLPGLGFRLAGYDFLEVSGLKPNTNYSFASLFFEGFEATRATASTVSETTPPIGSYFPLPIVLLRAEICKAVIRADATSTPVWGRAWGPLFERLCERTSPQEEFDSCGLRTFKLRLDVVDRMPAAILAAFADLVLTKNARAGDSSRIPSTKSVQQAVLRSANECLIAVDCACRAGGCHLALQGVSLTLKLVACLFRYRTKPHILLSLLTKCAASLEPMQQPHHRLAWCARARMVTTYLFHQIAVLCIQLRHPGTLYQQLEKDSPLRYTAHPLAQPMSRRAADDRVLDEVFELALLGDTGWQHAQGKATALLEGQDDATDVIRLLRQLSERCFSAVARDAAKLSLGNDSDRYPRFLSLMQCAVDRTWDKGGIEEPLEEVLTKHALSRILDRFLATSLKSFLDYGFMLRALPLFRLKVDVGEGDNASDGGVGAVQGTDGEAENVNEVDGLGHGAVEEKPERHPLAVLADHVDTAVLSKLELLRAASLLRELCGLKFNWHDISRFKFLDLQQVSVPELPPDDCDAFVGTAQSIDDGCVAGEAGADPDEGQEPDEWEVKENENKENRRRAFELLTKLVPVLVRAATYASATRSDQLLQMSIVACLNGLLVVGPAPTECLPPGPKSNPQDVDPDKHVGNVPGPEHGEKGESGECQPVPEDATLYLNLALLAQLAVDSLQRLKREFMQSHDGSGTKAEAAVDLGPHIGSFSSPGCSSSPSLGMDEKEETRIIRVANEASKAMESADEELHDVWFESHPDLDILSMAKVVAFAALCLYHMRRWSNVIALCRNFNEATCSVFATTFLPLAIGAQREMCTLSSKCLANTDRYKATVKAEFEEEQKKLPRKLVRQLALQGALSVPEKLFQKRSEYYEGILKRQRRLNDAWALFLKTLETSYSLMTRAVPAAMEQLRKSRILLAEFLQDRQAFNLGLRRGAIVGGERVSRERALRLAAAALVSSYRKAVELLRKRQMTERVVHALHELGNLQWLEGDARGAQASWSDAIDVAYQHVYAIRNWQKCIESSVKPPQDIARAELMLLTVPILAKHARLTMPGHVTAHLHGALFASSILEAVVTSALPHPSHRVLFTPTKYRMREIFFGLRESHALLPPNSVHGGVDAATFLGSLAFFQNALLIFGYQPARCLPFCSVYNYIATDRCRDKKLAIKGRLMMIRSLIKCRALTAAWQALRAIAQGHDLPRPLITGELLDRMNVEAQEAGTAKPFRTYEAPFAQANMQAVNLLTELTITTDGDASAAEAFGDHNLRVFNLLQAEFLVCICSYERVSAQIADPEEKERLAWLDKADVKLCKLWQDTTGNEDDSTAFASSMRNLQQEHKASDVPVERSTRELPQVMCPTRVLSEEDSQTCVDIRLLRATILERRGDIQRAIVEVLYAMRFMQLLSSLGAEGQQDVAADNQLRGHPDAKIWMMLRRRMVHLLISQGRLAAADAHIERGLAECQQARDEITKIDLLAAKVRVDMLNGKILEVHGESKRGAVTTAEKCMSLASRVLPIPTASAVYARMMLCLLFEHNPSLMNAEPGGVAPSVVSVQSGKGSVSKEDKEVQELEAQHRVVISPIAQDLQSRSVAPKDKRPHSSHAWEEYRDFQISLADMVVQSIHDVDCLLQIEGFELHPPHMNGLLNIGTSEPAGEKTKLPLLPALHSGFRDRHESDAREPPNIYFELMPLGFHLEIFLAKLRLEIGDIDVARALLQEAEARMTRCVYLLPWLYVQFCVVKLHWRRLYLRTAQASAEPGKGNHVKYRDPSAFADGVCPPTSSPVFRTFLKRACTPLLTHTSEWFFNARAAAKEDLDDFLRNLLIVVRVASQEGGHDYAQLPMLLREGIEEVLRTQGAGSPDKHTVDLLHSLFMCLVAVADSRKALHFELSDGSAAEVPEVKTGKDAKVAAAAAAASSAAPSPIDVATLPSRIALDMQHHLKRQAHEGALAYSPGAMQDAQKTLPFQGVVKHAAAIRRECDLFASIYHSDRALCDQLHATLANTSDSYKKAKVIDEALFQAIEAPPGMPSNGDVLIHWTHSDLTTLTQAPRDHCAFLVCICPLGECGDQSRPLVARANDVHVPSIRRFFDDLGTDVEHCKPAAEVATEYIEQRLRLLTSTLRGVSLVAPDEPTKDADIDCALMRLVVTLRGDEETGESSPDDPAELWKPTNVSAAKVLKLLKALLRLIDRNSSGALVTHPDLSCFLRSVFSPLAVFSAT